MNNNQLPSKQELLFAISDIPLGNGSEAVVYKVHMNPKYTVRLDRSLKRDLDLFKKILLADVIPERDIFEGRHFGQTVAWLDHPDLLDSCSNDPLITINYYSKGHDFSISKEQNFSSMETLESSIAITAKLVDKSIFPDEAYDDLFDQLKFLSSKYYTIDVGNELFLNNSNILPSVEDQKFYLIDIMPFVMTRDLKLASNPPLNPNHTKGFNSPIYIARALLYGSYKDQTEHSKSKELLDLRIALLDRILDSATRMGVSDKDTYCPNQNWNRMLYRLGVPESERIRLSNKASLIQDNNQYPLDLDIYKYKRINGSYVNQQ